MSTITTIYHFLKKPWRGHLLKKNAKEKFNTARILLFMLFISLLITHICKVPSGNQEREFTRVFTICFIKS